MNFASFVDALELFDRNVLMNTATQSSAVVEQDLSTGLLLHRRSQFSSIQFSPLTDWVIRGDIRNDKAQQFQWGGAMNCLFKPQPVKKDHLACRTIIGAS